MLLPKIKTAILLTTALMLCMSAVSFSAYASTGYMEVTEVVDVSLIVGASWLDGDMLRIDVTDEHTSAQTSIALRLSDHVSPDDNSPYISVQAVNELGNQSGVIQIRNPFYVPADALNDVIPNDKIVDIDLETIDIETPIDTPSIGSRPPLTPDGTGTVIDNVTDDGIEFFTVFSEDGNEFFLIVDRQRNNDNVYLLNTVTEEDLMSLARNNGREIAPTDPNFSGVLPSQTHPDSIADTSSIEDDIEETSITVPTTSNNNNLILVIVIVALVGGVAYYFKIYKKKQDDHALDFDDEDEDDDDWDHEMEEGDSDDDKD